MVWPIPGTLAVYHDEFHVMIYAPDLFRSVLTAMSRTVFVGNALLSKDVGTTGKFAVSDTRKY